MPTALLVGGGPTGGLTPLVLDATTEVSPRYSNTVTSHPVETGSTITDHVFRNNTVISVRGVIANDSLGNRFQDTYNENRIQTVHDLLVQLRDEAQLITVSSELKIFPNCVISGLTTPRTAQVGDTLEVDITLEQIQVTESAFVLVEGLRPRVNRGTKTPTNTGNPSNSEDTNARGSRIERVLRGAFPDPTPIEGGVSVLPLAADGNYNQSVVLEDTSYDMGLQYNDREQAWYADVGPTGFDPALSSVKVTTNSDALGNYQHLDGVPSGFLSVVDLEAGVGRVNREEFNDGGRYNLIYLERGDYDSIVQGVPA